MVPKSLQAHLGDEVRQVQPQLQQQLQPQLQPQLQNSPIEISPMSPQHNKLGTNIVKVGRTIVKLLRQKVIN